MKILNTHTRGLYVSAAYFLNTISFWVVECLFLIDGTLTLASKLLSDCYRIYSAFSLPLKSAIMENTALHKLIYIALQLTDQIK